MTPYERALLEQIAFLEDELERIRDERKAAELAAPPDSAMGWALRDPQFRQWLLRRQLESEVRP
jgi:hypothetical protein